MMKKLIYTLLFVLIPSAVWAVDAQTYTDPSQLPAAFTWNMERYDICNPTEYPAYKNENHTQTGIVITWDPNYVNSAGKYGKLFIENFYTNDSIPVCNIDFLNQDNRNFVWSEDGKKLHFSFKSVEIGPIKVKPSDWSYFKTAYIASGKKGSSEYWAYNKRASHARYAAYGYDGTVTVEFELDLENKTITTNSVWGIFMGSGSGTSPGNTRVFNFYTSSTFYSTDTDLVDIIRDKEEGDEVTVADDLLCVAFLPQYSYDNEGNKTLLRNVLVCKDLGKYANPDVNTAGAFDYMHETGVFQREYDQSNWVVLTSDEFTSTSIPGTYLNHIIKGGTIKGTFTDKRNPTIALSQLPTAAAVQTYTPNTYVVPSFNDAYAEQGSDVFFVRPKPQEYCQVMWANYDAGTDAFYVPTADDGTNVHNLSGGFAWEKTYLNMGTPTGNTVYTFYAMVNKVAPAPAAAGAPRRVATAEPDLSGGISESYVVMPLSLDSSSVLTGISTMRHDAEPVQTLYYSPTGLVSSSAFGGINIVVTRYTDGTTQARKVVIP